MNIADKPAYPVPNDANLNEQEGMTYREWLAGMAMQGFLANGRFADIPDIPKRVALWSVSHADALIAELEKTNEHA